MIDHTIYGYQNQFGYPNTGNYGFGYARPQVYQNNVSTIVFVKGEEEGRQYPQAPGTTIVLWDSEVDVFYRKTVDGRGNLIEFEVCDYTKREPKKEPITENQNELINALSMQVEKLTAQIEGMRRDHTPSQKKQGGNNAKPNV